MTISRTDVISTWSGAFSFNLAAAGTAYRLRLTNLRNPGDQGTTWKPWDYIEIDNRGNKGATIYWSPNGRTASSSLATGVQEGNFPIFKLPPDSVDRIFLHATSISAVAATNGTTIVVNLGRF